MKKAIKNIIKECVIIFGACVWIVWILAAMGIMIMGLCGFDLWITLGGFFMAVAWGGVTSWLSRISQDEDEDDWIPVWEELPPTEGYILVSFSNFSLPDIARYEEDEEGGAFYPGDEDKSYASHGLFVNAWMPLPERYKEEEEWVWKQN